MRIALKAYVTVFLLRGQQVLLLRRADDRAFAPGKWTGVGGRVEADELGDLASAALRELQEESGLAPESIRDLALRVVLSQPEDGGLVILAFFTGATDGQPQSESREGELQWVTLDRIWDLDMVANARSALAASLAALAEGSRGVRFGVCGAGNAADGVDLTMSPVRFRL